VNATYLQADLADEAARKTLVAQAAAHWGRLDVLVNTPGSAESSPMPISMPRRRQSGGRFTTSTWWLHGSLSPRPCRSCAAAAIPLAS
jgi:NAD(P)-dependent dehydrogenase (short-subunit alcohol dehydrogenase family)